MTDTHTDAPYHAHVYFTAESRERASQLHARLREEVRSRSAPGVLYVGDMRDRGVGPHPIPQFEIHFLHGNRDRVVAMLESSGLTALVHPLTDDDLADHTTLAHWIGTPLELDLTVLDPPGRNQGVGRFAKSDV
jgi:aromatic ring-cleaving dioxygenase